VERGISFPSIVSLYAICKALGISISEILTDLGKPSKTVIKEADQPLIRIADSAVSYRYLSGEFPERVIEVLINEFPSNYWHPLASHEGEEFGYVLEGHITLRIGEDVYSLGPGDSYHFKASKPHGYETSDKEGAKILMVTTQKFMEWYTKTRRDNIRKKSTT
jgi:quercetin dioxygenase-like cupin family protein